MRAQLIAELATSHGGDVDLAAEMIRAAADAGADYAKIQTYDLAKLNPSDPQRDWLVKAHLDKAAHERLMAVCQQVGVQFLSTPFDAGSLALLRELGLKTFKIASSESGNDWWEIKTSERWLVSYPWGVVPEHKRLSTLTFRGFRVPFDDTQTTKLTAIPLYPTPLEAVGRATLLDGWSCHAEGIAACQWAIAQGAQMIEAHLCLPGKSRVMAFDKTPEQFQQIRRFAEDVETMRSGVAEKFRTRWTA